MTNPTICSINDETCSANPQVASWGLCSAHYYRSRKYGDPHGGGTHQGAGARFCEGLIGKPTKLACIRFPYSTTGNGYPGNITHPLEKRILGAHIYVCELVHGPMPVPGMFAAHYCGKGHEACVNPSHIRWATPKENTHDRYEHGTMIRGAVHPNAKLSPESVRWIRSCGLRICEMARHLDVSEATVRQVINGRTWSHIA